MNAGKGAGTARLLAAVALLVRRYTGEDLVEITLDSRTDGRTDDLRDDTVRIDLSADEPAGELVRRVGLNLAGHPHPVGDVGAARVWLRTNGFVPAELVVTADPITVSHPYLTPWLRTDLMYLLDELASDPAADTGTLLAAPSYERVEPVDRAALHGGEPLADFDIDSTIGARFLAASARYPDRNAVIAGDGQVSYRELAGRAASVGAALTGDRGPVAVLCRHGVTTISALLGAALAGRIYVPLDPTYPPARLAAMLADAGAGVLLTDADNSELAGAIGVIAGCPEIAIHDVDALVTAVPQDTPAGPISAVRPDAPAYLLYTSGSTGAPKGVLQSHRNVLAGVRNHIRNFRISPADRTSVVTSFGFDIAVTDTFSALLSGAAAVCFDIRGRGLAGLAGALTEQAVTIYHSTPSVYRSLVASLPPGGVLPTIRAVLLGGEEVTARDVVLCRRHFGPPCVFVNGYGTTEVSFIAQHHIGPGDDVGQGPLPVGTPLDGFEVVLLDRRGRQVCLSGEVLVRSPHVALGYHDQNDRSELAKFVTWQGERAYRTGDLARRLPGGALVFLGRSDRQVKIRGHRVELAEVESVLADQPDVRQAAVVAKPGPDGGTELLGYVVPSTVDIAAARRSLQVLVPEYMVPRAIVGLDQLPLSATGKLDVRSLPEPASVETPDSQRSPLERTIALIWCVVLGVPSVGNHQNFFDLGGHSLLMGLVQTRLERQLSVRLSPAELFANPTVAMLAKYLAGHSPTEHLDQAADRMARRAQARAGRTGRP